MVQYVGAYGKSSLPYKCLSLLESKRRLSVSLMTYRKRPSECRHFSQFRPLQGGRKLRQRRQRMFAVARDPHQPCCRGPDRAIGYLGILSAVQRRIDQFLQFAEGFLNHAVPVENIRQIRLPFHVFHEMDIDVLQSAPQLVRICHCPKIKRKERAFGIIFRDERPVLPHRAAEPPLIFAPPLAVVYLFQLVRFGGIELLLVVPSG
ncbi:hypothetical protein D3C76_1069400 [compost metagenome]